LTARAVSPPNAPHHPRYQPDPLFTDELPYICPNHTLPPSPPLTLLGYPAAPPPLPSPPPAPCEGTGSEYDLKYALSLFFPSVTGIMAGSNRSGDLNDAQRSIPKGTIMATLCTSVLYVVTTFLWGYMSTPEASVYQGKKWLYYISAEIALPHEMIVRIGIILSSLGAGLQSLTGAPRLLQAIANDNLMPALAIFKGNGEPRNALLCTYILCFMCVSTGDLNIVAPIITMFFLLCYMFINFACLLQDLLQEPNWRPRFKYYHPVTSISGFVLCAFIMFYTDFTTALCSVIFVGCLYGYISYKKVEAQWGDGMVGLTYERARSALQSLEKLNADKAMHTKNWRPQILLMSKVDPTSTELTQPKAIQLLQQLKGGRGLSILGSVVKGTLAHNAGLRTATERSLRTQRDRYKLRGFVQCIMCHDVDHGLTSLIQTAGLGGLAPNTVMVCWPKTELDAPRARRLTKLFNEAHEYNLALIVCKGTENVPDKHIPRGQPIDIWWVVHDGGFQLLLSTILRKSVIWQDCSLRVFCVLQAGEDPDELQNKVLDFLYKMRIDAEVKCVVLQGTGSDSNALNRHRAKHEGSAVWAMNAAIVSQPIGSLLQGTSVTDDHTEAPRIESDAVEPDPLAAVAPSPKPVRKPSANDSFSKERHDKESYKRKTSVVKMATDLPMESESQLLHQLNLSEAVAQTWRATFTATKLLNSLFLKYSAGSALLITNLPMPSRDPASNPIPYTTQVTMLTANVPLCLLVAGQAKSDVVTMFS
jgi:hypothetical protein